MPDNWAYVFAAYAFAAVVLVTYWRHLARREREVSSLADRSGASRSGRRTMQTSAPDSRDGASKSVAPPDAKSNSSEPRDGTSNLSEPRDGASNSMNRNDERGRVAPGSAHPRSEPASRTPLQQS